MKPTTNNQQTTTYFTNLKNLINENDKLSYRKIARQLGISKTSVGDLCNAGVFHRDITKSDVERVLRNADIPEPTILTIWETTNGVDFRTVKQTKQILTGGPTMLKKHVLDFFGLERDPFTNEISDKSGVYMTPPHQAALAEMLDAARHQKFLGIWGRVGSGKTTMLNYFFSTIAEQGRFVVSQPMIVEKHKCRPSTICDAIIADMMYSFGHGLTDKGVIKSPSQLEAKSRFIKHLLKAKRDNGLMPVVVIDEAHDLPGATLKMLKRLHEIQAGFSKMLSIILIGQEELKIKLQDYRVREVTARINLVELEAIPTLTDRYIDFKLGQAGGNGLFKTDAIETLRGKLVLNNPLEINVIASKAMQVAFEQSSKEINADFVELAYTELQENARFSNQ